MRALRSVSTERGRDPREFALMAFGGAGPVHAAGLGRELGIGRLFVPPMPGLFSAFGLLFSGVEHHAVRSCLLSGEELRAEPVQRIREELSAELVERFAGEGFAAGEVSLSAGVDVRFRGQTSDISVPLDGEVLTAEGLDRARAAFVAEHERLYGHRSDPANPVEVTAVRVVGRAGERGLPGTLEAARTGPGEGSRLACFDPREGAVETRVATRRDLAEGDEGPLLIDEYDSTIVVPPGVGARTDGLGNILMELPRQR